VRLSLSPLAAVLAGGATVGVLDLLDGIIFFRLRGVAPIRIPHSIAAGILGRAAFQGGLQTAAIGVLLHFMIATTIVLTFYVVSRRLTILLRHPIAAGILYGLVVYTVMNYVVIPLSHAGRGAFSWPVLLNGLFIHAFGVGLPSALFARAARR
jgi:hypothetical protein